MGEREAQGRHHEERQGEKGKGKKKGTLSLLSSPEQLKAPWALDTVPKGAGGYPPPWPEKKGAPLVEGPKRTGEPLVPQVPPKLPRIMNDPGIFSTGFIQ